MTNKEFVSKVLNDTYNTKTRYVLGGQGQPLTKANKKSFKQRYDFNRTIHGGKNRGDVIDNTPEDYFAFDCCGYPKALLNGFCADLSKPMGGAVYNKVIKDDTIRAMMHNDCSEYSTDFSKIEVGEFVCNKSYGHCGIFVGWGTIENGRFVASDNGDMVVAEVTYAGTDGLQLRVRNGYWHEHGKFKMVEYEVMTLKDYLNEKVKAQKGDKGEYVREIQNALIKKGFSCGATGADGSFGKNTLNAVFEFQNALKRIGVPIEPTGIVDYETMKWLIAF